MRGQLDITKALADHWRQIFDVVHDDHGAGNRLLRQVKPRYDWKLTSPPAKLGIEVFLATAKNSAPGPDGLPYAAWRAAGPAGAATLFEALSKMAAGVMPLQGFNDSLSIFLPKGTTRETRARFPGNLGILAPSPLKI